MSTKANEAKRAKRTMNAMRRNDSGESRQVGSRALASFALMVALVAFAPAATDAQTSAGSAPAGKAATPAPGKDDSHRRDDIARHRQMARAHEDAARCLESGEKEGTCHEKLRDACKGIGVGRYCGMRHSH